MTFSILKIILYLEVLLWFLLGVPRVMVSIQGFDRNDHSEQENVVNIGLKGYTLRAKSTQIL